MKILGHHDDKTLQQLRAVAGRADHVALMADGHMGYVMPIGGVAAYRGRVSPIGVGVDIACGNAAIRTDLSAEAIRPHLGELADEIASTIGFGMGRPTNREDDAPTDHPLFHSNAWHAIPAAVRDALRERARSQLGTVGGGNHYVDVFSDESGAIWVGVHFGSRGLGFITAHGFVALAQGGEWRSLTPQRSADMNREVLLDLDSPLGDAYWTAMSLAGEYAYAGREWAALSGSSSTTTTTSPGRRSTTERSSWSSGRAQRRPMTASTASWAGAWATSRSSSVEGHRTRRCSNPRCTVQDGSWAGCKPRASGRKGASFAPAG